MHVDIRLRSGLIGSVLAIMISDFACAQKQWLKKGCSPQHVLKRGL